MNLKLLFGLVFVSVCASVLQVQAETTQASAGGGGDVVTDPAGGNGGDTASPPSSPPPAGGSTLSPPPDGPTKNPICMKSAKAQNKHFKMVAKLRCKKQKSAKAKNNCKDKQAAKAKDILASCKS